MSAPAFVEAETLDEAVKMLSAQPGAARVIGGGTGLMLMARSGFLSVETLVSLQRVKEPELRAIRVAADSVWVGGLCTLTQLERHTELRGKLPVLASTLARLSSVRTRNVATLAGGVVHGDPHMDLPPVLMALDATVVVADITGRRRVPCAALYRGYYDVGLEPGDLVVGVEIPLRGANSYSDYRKFTGALAEDWPVVGVAVRLERAGDRIKEAAVAVSAVESAARRLPQVEGALTGVSVTDLDPAAVGELAASAVQPTDDHLGSAWYKRKVLGVETTRAIRAWQEQVHDAQR
jgi:carbon-monoxide dehydrogenase medium subunit